MNPKIKKALRTAQSYAPALKTAKDLGYRYGRRLLRIPHERDFHILKNVQFSDEVFVDVGANHGQTIESVRLIRPDVKIISFEANPKLAKKLQLRYAGDPKVVVHDVGISDRPGDFRLYTPSYRGFVYDGLASLDQAEAVGWLSDATIYGFDARHQTVEETDCRVSMLDAFDIASAFLKIDVQGLEESAIRGGIETIRRHEPIILVEDLSKSPGVLEMLRPLGYEEFFVQGGRAARGRGPGANTLLMTSRRSEGLLA